MYFGTRTDEATSFALLDRFVEAGGTTIDTANCYAFWLSESGAGGQSEAVLGRWLEQNPGAPVTPHDRDQGGPGTPYAGGLRRSGRGARRVR